MIDLVIDLETLGTEGACPVIQIAGVCVCDGKVEEENSFNVCVDAKNQYGKHVNLETLAWWLYDPEKAERIRDILNRKKKLTGKDAATAFSNWMNVMTQGKEYRIWGCGPSFDLAILSVFLRGNGASSAWKFRSERCVRTALDLCGYSAKEHPVKDGPKHDALSDALREAQMMLACGAI